MLRMKPFLIIVVLFSCSLAKSQCSMEFTDTTHVNCNGENTGSFSINVVASNPYTISLSNGQTLINGIGFSNLFADNYEVVLVDDNQCSDTLQIKIKQPPPLSAEIVCEGNSIKANVEGGVLDYTFFWKNENGEVISNNSNVNYQPKTYYKFEVVDSKNCSVADVIDVNADFSVVDSVGEFPFEVNIINNSSNTLSYNWDFGDGNNSTLTIPLHVYQTVGTYLLQLTVEDNHLCQDKASLNIEVQGFELSSNDWQEMYNAFSPNGDGINDHFSFLENNAIVQFEVQIFNRWGNLVYVWTDPKESWKGVNQQGSRLTKGDYFYYLQATGLNGKEYNKKGVISIY